MVKKKLGSIFTVFLFAILFLGVVSPIVQEIDASNNSVNAPASVSKLGASEVDKVDSWEVTPRTGRWNISNDNSFADTVIDGNLVVGSYTTNASDPSTLTLDRPLEKTDAKGEYRFKGQNFDNTSEFWRDNVGDQADFEETDLEGFTSSCSSYTVVDGIATCNFSATQYGGLTYGFATPEEYLDLHLWTTFEMRFKHNSNVTNQFAVSVRDFVNAPIIDLYIDSYIVETDDNGWSIGRITYSPDSYNNKNPVRYIRLGNWQTWTFTAQIDYVKFFGSYDYITATTDNSYNWEESREQFYDVNGKIQDHAIEYFADIGDAVDFTEDTEGFSIYSAVGDSFTRLTTVNGFPDGAGSCYSFTDQCEIERNSLSITASTYTHLIVEFISELKMDVVSIFDGSNNFLVSYTTDIPAMQRTTLVFNLSTSGSWSGTETGIKVYFDYYEGWARTNLNYISLVTSYYMENYVGQDIFTDFEQIEGSKAVKLDNFDYFWKGLGNESNWNDGSLESIDSSFNSPYAHTYANTGSGELNISHNANSLVLTPDAYYFKFSGLSIDSSQYRYLSMRFKPVGKNLVSGSSLQFTGGSCSLYESWFAGSGWTAGNWYTLDLDLETDIVGCSGWGSGTKTYLEFYFFASGFFSGSEYMLIDYITIGSTGSVDTDDQDSLIPSYYSVYSDTLSVASSTYHYLGVEFYTDINITSIDILDSGLNSVCLSSTGWIANRYHLFTCDLDLDADWSGTETKLYFNFTVVDNSTFTVRFYNWFIWDYDLGEVEDWNILANAYYYVDPRGWIVSGQHTQGSTNLRTTTISVEADVFQSVYIRIKADSSSSRYFLVADSSGNAISSCSALTTSFQKFYFDIGADADWSGTETILRLYWFSNSGCSTNVPAGAKFYVDYVFLTTASGGAESWQIIFKDFKGNTGLLIDHTFENTSYFYINISLLDNQGLITSYYISESIYYDFEEYYIAKFNYDTLTSEWGYDLYFENATRIFKTDYPKDYSQIRATPYFYTFTVPPEIYLNYYSSNAYVYFESWLDYIQIDFASRDWIRDTYETDSSVLVNTVEELQTTSQTDISNSWNQTIPNLDSYSGDFQFNTSDNEQVRADGSIDNYAFSITLYSYDRDSGDEQRIISLGFFWTVISGYKVATAAVFYTQDSLITVPSSYYIYDSTNVTDASPFMSFSTTLSENRKQATSFVRFYPNEKDDTDFFDYTVNSTIDANAAQEFKLRVVHGHHDYDTNAGLTHKSQFLNFAFRERDIFADIFNPIGNAVNDIVGGIVQPIINFFQDILMAIFRFALSFINIAIQIATSVVTVALDALGILITAAISALQVALEGAINALGALLDATLQLIKGVLDTISSTLTAIANDIATLAVDIINGVVSGLNTVFQAIIDGLEAALEAAIGLVEAAVDALATFLSDILDEIIALAGYIVDQIISLMFDILDALIAALLLLVDVIFDLLLAILDFFLNLFGIHAVFDDLVEIFFLALDGIIQLIVLWYSFLFWLVSIFAFSMPLIVLVIWVYILLMPFKTSPEVDDWLNEVFRRSTISIVGDLSIFGIKAKPFSYLGVVNLMLTFLFLAII